MWVGTTAGPIGGDDLQLSVHAEPGAVLVVGSAGASIVLPGPTDAISQLLIDVVVGERASLTWRPEPTVIAAGARHRAVTTIEVGADADLIWTDELVLGRHAEQPGSLSSRLVVDGPDGPIVRTGIEIGEPGWDGPAVMGGRRALGQLLLIGAPAERWSSTRHNRACDCAHQWMTTTELPHAAQLVTVIAPSAHAMRAAIDGVVTHIRLAPLLHTADTARK